MVNVFVLKTKVSEGEINPSLGETCHAVLPNPRHFSLLNHSEFSSTLQISAAARLHELSDALLVHVLDLSLDTTVWR